MPNPMLNRIFLNRTDKDEIRTIITQMNPRKSSGDDEISVKLIQNSSDILINPLLFIFNESLKQGVVPDKLKIAKVIPIYKKGDKYSTKNYRPISLLSNFDKILEKLVYKRLIKFFNKYELLYNSNLVFELCIPLRMRSSKLLTICMNSWIRATM